MGTFLVRRILSGLLTVFEVSIIVFFIFFVMIPGDPALRLAGKSPTKDQIEDIRDKYGLDKPLPVQYFETMKLVVTGEITSTNLGVKVVPMVIAALPVTMSLVFFAMIIWVTAGVTAGTAAARDPGSRKDRWIMILALMGVALPIAWLSLYMLAGFTDWIPIFPSDGYQTISEGGIIGWTYHLLLPAITLSILSAGVYARMTRSNVRQAIGEEWVKTATAKGLPERQVFSRHVLRTGLIPIVVLLGLDLGALLGGAVFTESIFGLPGLGSVLITGISLLDINILIVVTMFGTAFVVFGNILADVVQAVADPRVRLS